MRGAEKQTGPRTFASAGVDRAHGKIIGYSALTATFNAKTRKARLNVAVALKGGVLVLGLTQGEHSGPRLHGRVLTGTGKFRGASGTFTATQTSETRTVVTVRYRVHS